MPRHVKCDDTLFYELFMLFSEY